MANMHFKADLLPNSDLGYSLGSTTERWKLYGELQPLQAKTYTNVIGTANNWSDATFFFGSVRPTAFTDQWTITYRVSAVAAGDTRAKAYSTFTLNGFADTYGSYAAFNSIYNTSYRPCYYHVYYRLKEAGFNNGYGHAMGLRLYSSWNPTTVANARTITIEILEERNCTFTFFDSMIKYASIPGTGNTNYSTYNEFDFATNGLQETGDANDVNYQNRIYYTSSTAATAIYRYQILLRTRNKQLIPVSTANNTFTIGKTYTTIPFDPFGEIYYYNSTTNISENGNLANSVLYRQILADFRYSFDLNNSANYKLVARQPVYLVATLQADGTAVITVPEGSIIGPLVQTLPNEEDGLIYIYLGQAYEDTNPYRVELMLNHPVYMYIDGKIQECKDYAHAASAITPDGTKGQFWRGDNSWSNELLGGLEIKGHIAGDSSTTSGHGLISGGGYHKAYNNILLHGDASTGTSGIAFVGDKVAADGTITNASAPSDRAFIQYHAHGITTTTAEYTDPTLGTSGETGKLVIGIGNDSGDQILLQAIGHTDIRHQMGATAAVIPDTNNTSGTVGSGTQPVWVEAGVIKNTSYSLAKSVPSNALFTDANVTQTNQTGSADYRILLSGQANDTTATEGANKSTNLRFNPSTKILSVGGSISATGDLDLTGDANLNGETYADSITAGSLLVNGAANFVQIPTSPTPEATSNDTSIATTAFVMNAFTANDAMVFKGVINANSGLPTDHKQGWTYRIGTAGTYANKVCEVGDIIICVTDGTAANNDHWAVIQNNIDGAVYKGTNTFVDGKVVVADGTAGKVKMIPNQSINTVYAGPSSGSAGAPSFRALVAADIPSLTLSKISDATDLAAIEALTGTSGLLKKTAANTWTLDTSSYVTSSGVTSITPGNGLLNGTGTSAITSTGTLNLNYGSSTSAVATTASAGTANTVSRSDHVHSISVVNNNINLSRNSETTIATIAGTAIKIKLPASDNTDTKVNVVARGTTKAYILADTTSPPSSAAAHTAVAETGVYLTTTAGQLNATSFKVAEQATIQYNTTTGCLEIIV